MPGGVSGGYGSAGFEGGWQGGKGIDCGVRPGVFVGNDDPSFATGCRNRNDLLGECRLCCGGAGPSLGFGGELVLGIAGNAVRAGDGFRCASQVDVLERVREHGDGAVQNGSVAEPVAIAGAVVEKWQSGHVFVAACDDNIGSSPSQLLRGRPDRLQSAAA